MGKRAALQEAFKFALSMVLMFWLALWMDWDMPGNGGLAILLVSLGTAGASYYKALYRVIGTTFGVAVGYFAIDWFGQSPWGTLIFFTAYIVFIGYMMQMSKAHYAWYVAGFVPFMVWSSSYMASDVDLQAFNYGTFRYLETTSGILIYTLVSILIWPKRAGDQLPTLGKKLVNDIRAAFGSHRNLLTAGSLDQGQEIDQTNLAGDLAHLGTTLDAAYGDTSAARENKKLWEIQRANLRSLVDALALWGESATDCENLDLPKHLPGLDATLDGFDRRLERLGEFWSDAEESPDQDAELLNPLTLKTSEKAREGLSNTESAALTALQVHWELLDRISRELLSGFRELAGFGKRSESSPPGPVILHPTRKVMWDSQRLVNALFPAACWVVAFVFWIYCDPPSGTSIPSTTVAISLNFVLARMNPMAFLVILLIGVTFIFAPVYMWVMPALDSGAGLLTLIFVYTFVFAYLGSFKPPLKLVPILIFVNMAGISNQQSYSFAALVTGALMFLFCFSIIAVVDMLWSSRRPEQVFVRALQRFFRGCATISENFSTGSTRGRIIRRRHFDSMVVSAPGQIQAAAKHLDPKHFPGCEAENVKDLTNGLEAVILRLQAVELAHGQLASEDRQWMEASGTPGAELREVLRADFADLAHLDAGGDIGQSTDALNKVSQYFEKRFDSAQQVGDKPTAAIFALLGGVHGLRTAVEQTRKTMRHFAWDELSKSRF